MAVNIFGSVTESADTRSWLTLPEHVNLARLSLPPGTYDLQVEILGYRGEVLSVQTLPAVCRSRPATGPSFPGVCFEDDAPGCPVILVLSLLVGAAAAEDPDSDKGTLTLNFENDALGSDLSDRHYTNGMLLSISNGSQPGVGLAGRLGAPQSFSKSRSPPARQPGGGSESVHSGEYQDRRTGGR